MATPNPPLTHAMLWPPWSIIERFTQLFPDNTPLAAILARFSDICKTSRHYRIDESDSQIVLAKAIENIPNIDLETRYAICFAPVSTRSKDMVDFFVRFAIAVSEARPVRIDSPSLGLPLDILNRTQPTISPTTLQTLEYLHKVIVCYCWLSVRWPALFTDFSAAQEWKERAELLIHEGLQSLKTAGADVGQGLRSEQLAIHPEWNRHPESI